MIHPSLTRECKFLLISLGLGWHLTPLLIAQDWHIGNPPVQQSVPQYQPIYPLLEQPTANIDVQPSSQPLPAATRLEPSPTFGPVETQIGPPSTVPFSAPSKVPAVSIHTQSSFGVDYTLYRDRTPFPIDIRKPCNLCTQPPESQPRTKYNWPGVNGRPYQEREPGGCHCGKKGCAKCSQFSLNWPAPFSARQERNHPSSAELRDWPCQPGRVADLFDPLVNFKLLNYQRLDNGYCGPGSDPYGCLGESRQLSRVAGVNFRNPGVPAAVPATLSR